MTLYETSTLARLEATAAAHPVDARMLGRVVSVNLTVGSIVRSGDILVELEADAERLALGEARAKGGGARAARSPPSGRK